ncbi:N utilization substance protein A [Serratia fonticola]|uniref:N utilization substance protein A n=1 Tax=Serratia fonticola TaxID=47917 RepID=A0A4U9UBG3_SERFO|nr:N utilization substance protein A [Serratia fonticola]
MKIWLEALRDRAKAALTTLALAQEESLGDQKPADDLLNLPGLERSMAFKLAARGVCTLEDLAEQGVDEIWLILKGLAMSKPAS